MIYNEQLLLYLFSESDFTILFFTTSSGKVCVVTHFDTVPSHFYVSKTL